MLVYVSQNPALTDTINLILCVISVVFALIIIASQFGLIRNKMRKHIKNLTSKITFCWFVVTLTVCVALTLDLSIKNYMLKISSGKSVITSIAAKRSDYANTALHDCKDVSSSAGCAILTKLAEILEDGNKLVIDKNLTIGEIEAVSKKITHVDLVED